MSATVSAASVSRATPRGTGRPIGYAAAKVFLYLTELAARGGGYRLKGVRGWADPGEIERHTQTWAVSDLLRVQVRRGRVIAYDARPPGERHPLWLYRVAQPGVDCLAESVNVWPAGVREPRLGGDPRVFLREGPLRAWQALKLASAPGRRARRVWVPDQPEWCPARELNALLAAEDEAVGRTARCFWSEDLRWMVRHSFADELVVDRTHVYKLTEAGVQLRPLEWRDPRS
jgi:hypothetical protein